MAVNTAQAEIGAEFSDPPADPIGLIRDWFDKAKEHGVREPGAVALATVSAHGVPSSRMIQTLDITDRGLVFTSHSTSPKGRDIAATGWGSGVLYWRETNQQLILTGQVELLDAVTADAYWAARPIETQAMSVATKQSEPLASEADLLAGAVRLISGGQSLRRPDTWCAYQLVPTTVEFWQSSPDRLYRRIRYYRDGAGWTNVRLQP
ncbi:MAG TPA: pyridoxal 5'-phosphate synthase [Micromonosporaceae bacterium]|nr:pyridoxal 5'-phosphate synthase [Micromonosporaceae bacterium]